MSNTEIVQTAVVTLKNTAVTRSYPFTQETIDQIKDIRYFKEDQHEEKYGEQIIYPAPVILAEAIAELHAQYFPERHAQIH